MLFNLLAGHKLLVNRVSREQTYIIWHTLFMTLFSIQNATMDQNALLCKYK